MAGRLGGLLAHPKLLGIRNRLVSISELAAGWFQRQVACSTEDMLPLRLLRARFVYRVVLALHMMPLKIVKIPGGVWQLQELTGIRKVLVTLFHLCIALRAKYAAPIPLRDELHVAIQGAVTFDGVLLFVVFLLGGIACIVVLVLYVQGQDARDLFNFGNQISQEIGGWLNSA